MKRTPARSAQGEDTGRTAATHKVVVIGGTGLVGAKLVAELRRQEQEAVAAAPGTGVNTLTGEGLDEALRGAEVVVDVSDAPSLQGDAAREFFETSTRNLLAAEARAGVRHHVALSVVGSDRLPGNEYMRAKLAQEDLIKRSSIPYTIVHATQFFEFVRALGDAATEGNEVRLAPVLFQPVAADDVAGALSRVAMEPPRNGDVEVAGPEQYRLDELVRRALAARRDPREVIADPSARYFGAPLEERTLLPGEGARIGPTTLQAWIGRQAPQAQE